MKHARRFFEIQVWANLGVSVISPAICIPWEPMKGTYTAYSSSAALSLPSVLETAL